MHALQDFKAIGIDKKGFQLKLEKEAKMLQSTKFKIDVPVSSYNEIVCVCMYI